MVELVNALVAHTKRLGFKSWVEQRDVLQTYFLFNSTFLNFDLFGHLCIVFESPMVHLELYLERSDHFFQ
jgi:hypothetical protein